MNMRCATSGFTLIELLVAAAASLILVGAAMSGLLMFQQMSNKMDKKLAQEADLNRALGFISRDIQQGGSVESGAPVLSGYRGLFKVVRPAPDSSSIGYYTVRRRSQQVWSGPNIIYRKDFRPDKDGTIEPAYALIDQISSHKPTDCPNASDTLIESGVGFSVRINPASTKATLCLAGAIDSFADASNDVLEVSAEAAVRAR